MRLSTHGLSHASPFRRSCPNDCHNHQLENQCSDAVQQHVPPSACSRRVSHLVYLVSGGDQSRSQYCQSGPSPLPQILEQPLSGGSNLIAQDVFRPVIDVMCPTERAKEEIAHQPIADEVPHLAS